MKENPYAKYVSQPVQGENPYAKYVAQSTQNRVIAEDGLPVNEPKVWLTPDVPEDPRNGFVPDLSKSIENLKQIPQDLQKRGANFQGMVSRAQRGDEGALPQAGRAARLAYNFLGTQAGAAGDILSGIGGAAYNATPDLPFLSENPKALAKSVIGSAPVQSAVKGISEGYGKFKQQNPNAADILESTGNIAMIAPAIKPASRVLEGAGRVAKALEKAPIASADELRAISTKSYDLAEKLGGKQGVGFTDELIDYAKNIAPTDPYARIGRGTLASDSFIEELAAFKGKPMTLANAEALDKNLTNKIADTFDVQKGTYNDTGKELINLQSKFRDMIETNDKYIEGGKEGFDAYKKGRSEWAAARRMDDVEDIFRRAEMTNNPATSIKAGFRNLAMNKKRLQGYTKKEIHLIESAAKSNLAADTLRTVLGSRLIGTMVGASGGGLGGAAAGAAASAAARGAASKFAVQRGEKVAREIGKRVKIPKEIYNLPPADAIKAIEALKASAGIAGTQIQEQRR